MEKHKVIFTPSGIQTDATAGDSLYNVALRCGVDIESICGGSGLCKRCQIELSTGHHAKFNVTVQENHLSALSPTEKKALHDGEIEAPRRLACRAKILGDVVIEIPSDSRQLETSIQKQSTLFEVDLDPGITLHMVQLETPTLEDNPSDGEALSEALARSQINAKPTHRVLTKLQGILHEYDRTLIAVVRDGVEIIDVWPPSPFDVYGAALDIGSTSLALYVYNLCTGALVYEKAAMNPQIRYGEDLMSRVSYIMMNKGGEEILTSQIRKQIKTMFYEASQSLSLGDNQLLEMVVVGNPIMHHLFIGASPVDLGQSPFTLATKDWLDISSNDLDIGLPGTARVSLLPLIGGHVGADTTGAYLTQLDVMANATVLLVDIGTNAEIMLSHKGKVAAASSPTGPALEGAEISCGVRASRGAIERIRLDKDSFQAQFKIIGHDEWLHDGEDLSNHSITGICGSGIFEIMVELANYGLIDQSGLFVPERAPGRFVEEGKSWKFLLVDRAENPLYIKQTDIRAVQLAKAALSAGVSLLADHLECNEFDKVLLAGAFGTHLDPDYVSKIGILPNVPASRITSIGNAAGMGAAMALLNKGKKAQIIKAVKFVEKLETATEPRFQQLFVDAMKFPTAPPASNGDKKSRRSRRRSQRGGTTETTTQ